MQKYYGQSAQDYYVAKCTKEKINGTFVEIGSNHPMGVNNTFLLEHKYGEPYPANYFEFPTRYPNLF